MRPIDADELKELLIETLEGIAKMPAMTNEEMHVIAASHMLGEMIDDAQTLDCEPVMYGEWIHDVNNLYGCSVCFQRETMSHKAMKRYCPRCGAKMYGKGDDHEQT